MPAITGQQSVRVASADDPVLPSADGKAWFDKARLMRKHPTIAMVRSLVMAPALAAEWATEVSGDAPEGAQDLIDETFMPVRLRLMRAAMAGCFDYGWQGFEKVWEPNANGALVIKKFKPLLVDITTVLVDPVTGAFTGLRNEIAGGDDSVDLTVDAMQPLLMSCDVEGTDWYGEATMKNLERAYDEWLVVDASTIKYDKRVSSSVWEVGYPTGSSEWNGSDTPNDEIADALLDALISGSNGYKVPRKVEALIENLNENAPDAWKIELKTDPGNSKTLYMDRFKYLDVMFARGAGLPERAILEGQFGTKAEASEHADFAITNIELRNKLMIDDVNAHAVDHVLVQNYGDGTQGTVRLVPTPLSDPKINFLKEVYRAVLQSDTGMLDELDKLDLDALKDKVGVPQREEDEEGGVLGVVSEETQIA